MSAAVHTRRLIQNALYIPEINLWLKSTHVHDYVAHTLTDGTYVSTDGGCEYLHRTVSDPARVIPWDLYVDDPFEVIADKLLWGTYGPEGKGPFKRVPLRDCELDHLRAIRETQAGIRGTIYGRVVDHWITVKERAAA